jgi:CheY-like chemotaxis protein
MVKKQLNCTKEKLDLILMDIQMPHKMDQTTAEIKHLKNTTIFYYCFDGWNYVRKKKNVWNPVWMIMFQNQLSDAI